MSSDATFDVIVAGLGAWGSAAIQHIAARNHRVLGIDRFKPPHAHGSTHGHSRLINSKPVTSAANLERIRRSYELWRDLERTSGRDLMDRVGWLHVGVPNSQRIAPSLIADPDAVLTREEIAKRFPQLRLKPDEVGIFDQEAAVLDPEECVSASLDVAAHSGAEYRFGEPIVDWSADPSGVRVDTASGRYEALWLVLALGAWTPLFSKWDLPLWTERQVMVWFDGAGVDLPGFSFPGPPPATSFYGMRERSGRVKVALHHGGVQTDADLVAPVGPADIDSVRVAIADRIPDLKTIVASATCIYPDSADYGFIVGAHPAHDHVLVLAGGSGSGFHQSQVIGEIAADRIDGRSRPDADGLSPDRFASLRSKGKLSL